MKKFDLEYEQAQLRSFSAFVIESNRELARMCNEAIESGQKYLVSPPPFESFESDVLAHYTRNYKLALRPMLPRGIKFSDLIRLGSHNDGGYVMLPPGEGGIAYSLGIDTNVDWDLAMAERGFEIWQYDGSITALPQANPAFHFQPEFVYGAEKDFPAAHMDKCVTLSQLLARNGHSAERSIILKMDIEGGEWSVFENLDQDTLQMFSQIIVELHIDTTQIVRLPYYTGLLNKLLRTHVPVHVHANNSSKPVDFCGEKFVYIIEASYVRRADYQGFAPSNEFYPTPLDAPCQPYIPEIEMGYLGKLKAK